jgi:hypothetical protein
MIRPTGRREIAENVLTAVLCAAATALLDAGIKAIQAAREKRQAERQESETPNLSKKRRKGKK